MVYFYQFQLVKPPPGNVPLMSPSLPMVSQKPGKGGLARPFPVLTPQSYLPGAASGYYPGLLPQGGLNDFPMLNANSFLPPGSMMEPPIINVNAGHSVLSPSMFPIGTSPPMMSLPPPPPPPPPYPSQVMGPMIAPQRSFCEPVYHSSYCRPSRNYRRRYRSRRRRPVIYISDSSSCSSLSSCSTISSCSRHRHRSHSRSRHRYRSNSHSRRCRTSSQPQQPIILLPMPTPQSQPALIAPTANQIQQPPQRIILPPVHVQTPGQFQQQLGGSFQQTPLALPPIQFNSSDFMSSANSSPIMIPSGQPMLQPSMSMPQITNFGQPQQIQGAPIQYVQAAPQSSSPLQYISAEPRSTLAPQRVLVNSTNKKQSTKIKPVDRSVSTRHVPQSDLKYGRRPFDWYANDKKKNIINENIRIGQRGNTAVS